jgi:hypothetical protein
MENQSAHPSAGWYPDPAGSGGYRYWDGAQWSDQPAVSNIPRQARHWLVRRSIIAGILIAVSPIIKAFVGSIGSGTSMFNESQGSGAAIWLVFMTVPLGFVVAGVGAIVGSVLQSRAKSNSDPRTK